MADIVKLAKRYVREVSRVNAGKSNGKKLPKLAREINRAGRKIDRMPAGY